MTDNIWGGIEFCNCSHSSDFYLTNVRMILLNFEEIIHYSFFWLRFILFLCRLRPPPKAKPVSLSLSVCLTSLITTWRNVHYFSSPFVSEPLLEEQEGEGVRSYSLAPPWHKSRLIIMLKLPGILKWREREKESGSKHSGNLNQLCKLHFFRS